MTSPDVLDYSFSRPNLAALPASVVGVCRYLRGSGKALDAGEAASIQASGRFIVVNDETTSGRAAQGAGAGSMDGAAAGTAARSLGIPSNCVIHPSVDFDVTTQMGAVIAYMTAYKQASGYGLGCYGEADVVDALANAGLLTTGFGWQTIAWSGGRISSHAGLYQYAINQSMAGGSVDFNRLINLAGLGVWGSGLDPSGGGTPIPAPIPTPVPLPKDDDMPFIAHDPGTNSMYLIGAPSGVGDGGYVDHIDPDHYPTLNKAYGPPVDYSSAEIQRIREWFSRYGAMRGQV